MSKEDLEKPVNGYQFLLLLQKIDALNGTVETIKNNTTSVVTHAQLAASEKKSKDYVDKEIDDAVELVHEKYKPIVTEHNWVKYTLIGHVIIQVIVFGALYLIQNGLGK